MSLYDYGRRQIITYNQTGQPHYRYQPLAAHDFLDPQEGDEFVHGERHDAEVRHAYAIFRHLYRHNPFVAVFSGVKMIWDIPGLAQPAPDMAVTPNVANPKKPRAVFDVGSEATRPRFVLEVTSPRFAAQDLEDKKEIYARAGVKEYFIVDSGLRETQTTLAMRVLGYRLDKGLYVAVEPDERGWLYSAINKVWLALNESKESFIVMDGRTGKPIAPDEADALSPVIVQAEARFRAQTIADHLRRI